VKRFCIIGAGACGLAVAKTFAERGIPFDCFEALADIGGIWNPDSPHVVYGSTFLNSSKRLSRYPDFHFPEEWSHYVSRTQAQSYLRAYASEFGLYQRISFNSQVTSADRTEQGWRVMIEGELPVRTASARMSMECCIARASQRKTSALRLTKRLGASATLPFDEAAAESKARKRGRPHQAQARLLTD